MRRRSCSPSAGSRASRCRRSPTRRGTHKTTVLYHFETKDALHEAVLDEALGRVVEVTREFLAGDFRRERVAYLLDQMHAFYAEHPAHRAAAAARAARAGRQRGVLRAVRRADLPAGARRASSGRWRRADPARSTRRSSSTTRTCTLDRLLLPPRAARAAAAGRRSVLGRVADRAARVSGRPIFRQLTPDVRSGPPRGRTTKGATR